jgi:teichuronic acid biosynthesis glycosyltransferase TuaH
VTRARGAVPPAAVVYLAGSRWHDVEGTDRRLVTALARYRPVLWVDPPQSALRWRRTRGDGEQVAAGVTRVSVLGPPGLTRPLVRDVARAALRRRVRRATRRWPGGVDAVVSAAPHGVLAGIAARRRVFFATDDYVDGAELMGLSPHAQRRAVAADVAAADVVAAVSPGLAEQFAGTAQAVAVVPNGCEPSLPGAPTQPVPLPFDGPVVGLVGQLNERLDLDVLARLRAARLPVLVVGPLTVRDRAQRQRLLSYLYSDGVHWVGPVPAERVGDHLAVMAVGITPYRSTPFNRGSFPLKTLDYLAAGLPVVTTPLPASDWLDSPLVAQADAERFVDQVRTTLAGRDAGTAARCRELAARHGWADRAERLAELCDGAPVRTLG